MARFVAPPEHRDWPTMFLGKKGVRCLMNQECISTVPFACNQSLGLKMKDWSQVCKYLTKVECGLGD